METAINRTDYKSGIFITQLKILCATISVFIATIAFSQNPNDSILKSKKHYEAIKAGNASRTSTIVAGDQVMVMKRGFDIGDSLSFGAPTINYYHFVCGTVNKLFPEYFTTSNNYRVEISHIVWIRKTKSNHANVIIGSILSFSGLALLTPVVAGKVEAEKRAPLAGLGLGLMITGGITIALHPTRYNLYKGDRLIYKE